MKCANKAKLQAEAEAKKAAEELQRKEAKMHADSPLGRLARHPNTVCLIRDML